MRQAQQADTSIRRATEYVIRKVRPRFQDIHTARILTAMMKQFDKLRVKRGVLQRVVKRNEEEVHQIVLPKQFHQLVLTALHDDVGHMGRDHTQTWCKIDTVGPR